jgi:hypothetical protein
MRLVASVHKGAPRDDFVRNMACGRDVSQGVSKSPPTRACAGMQPPLLEWEPFWTSFPLSGLVCLRPHKSVLRSRGDRTHEKPFPFTTMSRQADEFAQRRRTCRAATHDYFRLP